MALDEADLAQVREQVARMLALVFEQFAIDEHDNYVTIEQWASKLTGSVIPGSLVTESGAPTTPAPGSPGSTTVTIIEQALLGNAVDPATQFGIPSSPGTGTRASRVDHQHGTPKDPLPGHQGHPDPHTQYLLRAEDVPFEPDDYPLLWRARETEGIEGIRRLSVGYSFPDPEFVGELFVKLEV